MRAWVLALILVPLAGCLPDVETFQDLVYDDNGPRNTLDIRVPDGASPGTPAVLWIHGGSWRGYSKASLADDSIRLAATGYVVVTINYRLVPDGAYPLLIQDCYCALGWVQAHADEYFIDPEQIAVMGYSAGGHLAGLLGLAPAEGDFEPDCDTPPLYPPVAVVSGAGPMDMRLLPELDAVTEFLGGKESQVPEIYDRASPITYVRPDAPPFLFFHGSDDLIVRYEHTEKMVEALEDAGNRPRVMRLRGGGHVVNPGADLFDAAFPVTTNAAPEAWAAILDFLDETLVRP